MSDTATIQLESAEMTRRAGSSLARTLYETPVTVLLQGELGAGKTVFLQGFAEGLGILQLVTSPTYALEQRYRVRDFHLCPAGSGGQAGSGFGFGKGVELLHMDLYRLSANQARNLVDASEDHPGIRCIEWAERLPEPPPDRTIAIHIEESHKSPITNHQSRITNHESRTLTAAFADIPLPSRQEIESWRKDVRLPKPICMHCDAVAAFAETLGSLLLERGQIVRPLALKRAAEVHDLLRFIDFRPGAGHTGENVSGATKSLWQSYSVRYDGMRHEPACAAFLREHGYDALATIVEVHGLRLPSPERTTIEQKLLFYADKRVRLHEAVTLEERFEDFRKRYKGGKKTQESEMWFEEAKKVEKELFPEGVP